MFPLLYWLRIHVIFLVLSTLSSIVEFPNSFILIALKVSDDICMVLWSRKLRLFMMTVAASGPTSAASVLKGSMAQHIYGTVIHICAP